MIVHEKSFSEENGSFLGFLKLALNIKRSWTLFVQDLYPLIKIRYATFLPTGSGTSLCVSFSLLSFLCELYKHNSSPLLFYIVIKEGARPSFHANPFNKNLWFYMYINIRKCLIIAIYLSDMDLLSTKEREV